jgi:hypothetical protein
MSSRARRSTPDPFRRRAAARHRRSAQARAETAVSIRQHQIELLATGTMAQGQRGSGQGVRQVFLGSSRDYMVEVADGTQLR